MNDCISRQAAIEAVHKTIYGFFGIVDDDSEEPITKEDERLLIINKAITARIKSLPSAHPLDPCETCLHKGKGWDEEPCDGCTGTESKYEPDNGWIPVSERLPNDGDRVIVQMLNGHICIIEFSAWGVTNHLVAWMPLPEPYKEEE